MDETTFIPGPKLLEALYKENKDIGNDDGELGYWACNFSYNNPTTLQFIKKWFEFKRAEEKPPKKS